MRWVGPNREYGTAIWVPDLLSPVAGSASESYRSLQGNWTLETSSDQGSWCDCGLMNDTGTDGVHCIIIQTRRTGGIDDDTKKKSMLS